VGDISSGPDELKLASRFLYAGAKCIVLGALPLTDKGAERFAEEFYRNVFKGCSVGESLLATRKKIISDSGDLLTALSYVLFGNGDFNIGPTQASGTSIYSKNKSMDTVQLFYRKGALSAEEIQNVINESLMNLRTDPDFRDELFVLGVRPEDVFATGSRYISASSGGQGLASDEIVISLRSAGNVTDDLLKIIWRDHLLKNIKRRNINAIGPVLTGGQP